MAELKIKADSGGGSVSLKGPASSGATPSWRLPSADGSSGQFMKTDGSGVLSFATVDTAPEGNVVKSTTNGNEAATKFLRADGDGTCSWQIPPDTGKILQVVQTVKTDTASREASGFADIPGMSVNITPASGTKILVHYSIQTSHTNGARFAHTKLVRDSTDIAIGDEVTSRTRATTGVGTPAGNGDYMLQNQTMVFLDTHGADGSTDVVYKLQWWIDDRTSQSTIWLNRTLADMGNAAAMRGVSTITAVEVAA